MSDRIELSIAGSDTMVAAFETDRELVMGETLATAATASVDGTDVSIVVERAP